MIPAPVAVEKNIKNAAVSNRKDENECLNMSSTDWILLQWKRK